jgi:hypothetical protein
MNWKFKSGEDFRYQLEDGKKQSMIIARLIATTSSSVVMLLDCERIVLKLQYILPTEEGKEKRVSDLLSPSGLSVAIHDSATIYYMSDYAMAIQMHMTRMDYHGVSVQEILEDRFNPIDQMLLLRLCIRPIEAALLLNDKGYYQIDVCESNATAMLSPHDAQIIVGFAKVFLLVPSLIFSRLTLMLSLMTILQSAQDEFSLLLSWRIIQLMDVNIQPLHQESISFLLFYMCLFLCLESDLKKYDNIFFPRDAS